MISVKRKAMCTIGGGADLKFLKGVAGTVNTSILSMIAEVRLIGFI